MITYSMSDEAVLSTLGEQLRQIRLNQNYTQQQLADRAGVSRSTVSELENGGSASLLTLVQVLRALNKLELLNAFATQASVSPLQIARLKGKTRRRASGRVVAVVNPNDESEW